MTHEYISVRRRRSRTLERPYRVKSYEYFLIFSKYPLFFSLYSLLPTTLHHGSGGNPRNERVAPLLPHLIISILRFLQGDC